MRRCLLMLLSLASLQLAAAAPSNSMTYERPGTPAVGGVGQMCLVYHGNKTRLEWTPEMFMPYVTHVDTQGQPTDWLFDSFLFTEYIRDNGVLLYHYKPGVQATAEDWAWLADCWFREKTGLIGLEGAVESAGHILGDPNHQVNVVIAMPIALRQVGHFGPFPGSTTELDFAQDPDRAKAEQWYIDRVIEHWQKANYKHLRLAGFYWTDETVPPYNEKFVGLTADIIHQRGCKLFWIPFFSPQGFGKWKELGFDGVMLQPNYFFPRDIEAQRLMKTASKAQHAGSGVEMEFDKRVFESPERQERFWAYLDAGVKYGWMTNSLLGFYEGNGCLHQLVQTPGIGRQLYDALYQFVKGTYQPSGRSHLADFEPVSDRTPARSAEDNLALVSKGAKVVGCQRPPGVPEKWSENAIDGVIDDYGGLGGFAYFPIPGSMTIELPALATVARTQMLLWDLDDRWFQYQIETSPDNVHWQPAVNKSLGKWSSWQVDNFPPRTAKFIRLTGLHDSRDDNFIVVEVEAYSQPAK